MDETFLNNNVVQEQNIPLQNVQDSNDQGYIPEITLDASTSPKKTKKRKGLLVVGIIVIVFIAILIGIWQIQKSFGLNSPEKVTEHFLKALEEQDADGMYRLLSPDYISYMEEAGSIFGMTPKSDVSDQIDFFFEDMRDYYGIGLYKSLSYEEDDIEMQTYRGNDLAEMQEYFREEFNMEIDAFTQANITLCVEGTKGKGTVSMELFLFQTGRKWYYIDWYWD